MSTAARAASASAASRKTLRHHHRARRRRSRHAARRDARHCRPERRRQIDAGAHHRRRGAADAGQLTFDGRPWSPTDDWQAVAVVHQEPQLFPNLTVAENVVVGREGTSDRLAEARRRRRCGHGCARHRAMARTAARRLLAGDAAAHRDRPRRCPRCARVPVRRAELGADGEESDELFREMHKLAGVRPHRRAGHAPAERLGLALRARGGRPRRAGAHRSCRARH